MARSNVREQMIRGAAELLSTDGVQGTSFSDVLQHTGAPRGSIYHHFPGGKDELVREAAASVGAGVAALLDALDVDSPELVVSAFVGGWRSVLVSSDHRRGCAVAATCVGAGGSSALLDVAGEVFAAWRSALGGAFVRSGVPAIEADDLAAMSIAAVEGALVLGRAARSDEVFDVVERQLRRLVSTVPAPVAPARSGRPTRSTRSARSPGTDQSRRTGSR